MAIFPYANRGNVAIIVWNTLEAPYVWDVNQTEYEGTINLGNSGKSLLGIYFRDFATEDGKLKEIEDVEISKIDKEQLILDASDVEFAEEFDKAPSKNKDEKSYKTYTTNDDNEKVLDKVYVYVPEDVWEDLDELENKEISLILGKDNVAVLITIEDDITEKDFLTAYDDEKAKITIGETKYDLADDDNKAYGYTVELNGVDVTPDEYAKDTRPIEVALNLIDADMDWDEIEKKIEIEVTLNEDDDVKAIDLTTSATITNISAEVLVTKVKETSSKYTIYTTDKNITWDIDDEDDLDFPKVYVDGNKADIKDIEAGNVLTVLFEDNASEIEYDLKDIAKIYASTKVVTDKADRIKKGNLAITLDGTVYTATGMKVTMSTEEISKYNDEDDLVLSDYDAVVDNDTVTLYLNMFGEYAFVTLDEVASNWTFGVVTYVSSNVTWEGDDEEIAVRNFKLLLDDGTKATYKLKVDTDDEDITREELDKCVTDEDRLHENTFVAIKADADKVVTIEDGDEVVIIYVSDDVELVDLDGKEAEIGDYAIRLVGQLATNKDDEEFGTNDEYEYASKTVIFNTTEKEIVSKWKSILDTDGTSFADNETIAIFEDEDEDEALYLVVALDDKAYGSEDAVYAIVEESENVGDDNYVKFVGQDEMKAKEIKLLDEGWLVAYKTASSKVSEVQKLIDVKKVSDAKDTKKVIDYLDTSIVEDVKCPNYDDTTATECDCDGFEAYRPATNAQHGTITCGKTTADGAHIAGCSKSEEALTGTPCTGTATCPDSDDTTDTTCDKNCSGFTPYVPATDAVHGTVKAVASFALSTSTAPKCTVFVDNIDTTTTLEQIVLEEVEVKSSGKSTLKFVETGDDDLAIDSVKVSEDVKVYDLRNGEVKEIDIDDLANEVNEENEDVYVLAAVNGDYDNDGANVLFIVK